MISSGKKAAITVKNLHKSFILPHEKHSGIKQAVIGLFRGEFGYEKQNVLKNISFDIQKGEFFGIVGRNGSGKSTLLKLLAGIYTADEGSAQVNGKLTPFIELGVGFNPELTGRENVFLNGALLGFSQEEMAGMYDDIVEFAELEKFMDQRLKNYSSGMQVRLAFSIAIRAKSDILLLDEVLAVGDAIFQQKCFDYFRKLKQDNVTVVLVSHDANILEQYCSSGVLIEQGEIVYQGKISKVVNEYRNILVNKEEQMTEEKTQPKDSYGTLEVEVSEATAVDRNNQKKNVFTEKDETISIRVTYIAHADNLLPVYGIIIYDANNQPIITSNTLWSNCSVPPTVKGQKYEVSWTIRNIFNTGTLRVSPAVADQDGVIIYNWKDYFCRFKVRKRLYSTAVTNVSPCISINEQS